MASDLVRFSVTVPQDLLEQFDAYARCRGTGTNRSEAVRDLIRERLVVDGLAMPQGQVVGSITMVYDHHVPDLTAKLDEIQHHSMDEIVSTMHVHLDHHNCLEILAVRGDAEHIRSLANRLLGLKGVRHGELTCVATADALDHS